MPSRPRKLNVFVYEGEGSTIESVRHAIYSLRRLLSPNYAVAPITETALLKEPWAPTCALLVFPGGADLGYCRVFNGQGNAIISQFVRRGGLYLGFCAGGYYGSRRCEFEVGNKALEVVGSRELAFFPGTCRGAAFKGFQYHSEKGARAVRIKVSKDAFKGTGVVPDEFTSYYNGGGVFVKTGGESSGIETVGTYADDLDVEGGGEKSAVVYCKVGQGAAMLTGPHPEFAAVNLSRQNDVPGYDELIAKLKVDDDARTNFLRSCLRKLGLDVNEDTSTVPSTFRFHLSSVVSSDVDDLVSSWQDIITKEDGEEFVKGEVDTFHLERPNPELSLDGLKESLPSTEADSQPALPTTERGIVDYSTIIKHVVLHNKKWPEPNETPYFNHHAYYNSLQEFRTKDTRAQEWGDFLMYGEVLTSTNTIMDKNFKLLSKLPSGFTVAATTQVAGRGRGTNCWVAPTGSMIMSTVITHPANLASSRPIVFIQYLAAIAIVEAVKSYDIGYEDVPLKIKWPNDVYARDPTTPPGDPPSYVKIAGILANCSYCDGEYKVVLGIGVNTNNGRPTTSLDALLPPHLAPFRVERLLARLLVRLEVLYRSFVRRGFAGELESAYYKHWLHGGQVVNLEAHSGARARVVGITTDWGMLRAEELGLDDKPTGRMWALQSDENSFDFFRGLIRRRL